MKTYTQEEIKNIAKQVVLDNFKGRNNWSIAIYTLLNELGIEVPYTVKGHNDNYKGDLT